MKTKKRRKSTKNFLNQKIHIANRPSSQKTAQKKPTWYANTIFLLANEENCLKIQFSVCIDNFEQYFETSLLITQNDLQSFVNNMKNVLPIEKQQTKTFRLFRVFEYGLWQKTKTWKHRKSTESFIKQRPPVANI